MAHNGDGRRWTARTSLLLRIWGLGVRLLSGAPQFQRLMKGGAGNLFPVFIGVQSPNSLRSTSPIGCAPPSSGRSRVYDRAQSRVTVTPFILRTDGRGLGRRGGLQRVIARPSNISYRNAQAMAQSSKPMPRSSPGHSLRWPRSRFRQPRARRRRWSGSETAQTVLAARSEAFPAALFASGSPGLASLS